MDIEGLVYLLNQAGVALAQANSRIAQLEQVIASAQHQSEAGSAVSDLG